MKTNFGLQKYHHYTLTELELMMPWEREALVIQTMQWLDEERKRLEQRKHGRS